MKNFIRILICSCCLTWALPCAADLFNSQDDLFTIDMPAGWSRVKNPSPDTVLALQKATARIDIKKTDCAKESCIDQAINRDLAQIKAKQMTVIKNTYTDEEIKRMEFSTGEPFVYIHFYSAKNDFSAGYFLINQNGYSILARNLTYAQADLIFASITPVVQESAQDTPTTETTDTIAEIDLLPGYNTTSIPQVDVEVLEENPTAAVQTQEPVTTKPTRQFLRSLKIRWKRWPVHTLVSKNMPPFLRELGHGFDVFMGLLFLFIMGWLIAGIVRLFVRPLRPQMPVNPNSLYPLHLARLYGTPSIIVRAKDNQGNILTALSSRWDALVMFTGIIIMLLCVIVMATASLCEQLHLLSLSAFFYNTLYATASLLLPLGFVIFFCAIVWGQITMNEITLFDRKGEKAAIILQRGYSLSKERYQLFFVRSKELLLAERKRFCWRRQWKLLSKDQIEFATVQETSAWRAGLRMLCGHLWGMLRADYTITGTMESHGSLQNTHALFNKIVCNIDKPEAVNARDLLALSLLITIRDRDKWYPWFN